MGELASITQHIINEALFHYFKIVMVWYMAELVTFVLVFH